MRDETWVTIRPRAGDVPGDLGAPRLPASKSHAQRALLLAALGAGTTELVGVPNARDVQVLGAALERLGARIERELQGGREHWRVEAAAAPAGGPAPNLECADNATALRMLLLVLAVLGRRALFSGAPRLQQRPLDEARAALAALGATLSAEWPLRLDAAPAPPGELAVSVRAQATSQVASGALLALGCRAALGAGAGRLEVVGQPAAALGYLDVTAEVVRAFGLVVAAARSGQATSWTVSGGAGPTPRRYTVPADASAATFVAALAAMHARPVPAWATDEHPDWRALEDLARLRAASGSAVRIDGLSARPDSFPALCVVAAARAGVTELRGAPALRHKESDRIAAMVATLRAVGVECAEFEDGLTIHGRDLRRPPVGADCPPVRLPAVDDHRVVMAGALLGSLVPQGVAVAPRRAPDKSWPGFFAWLARVARVE